jgi:hypothetical protein
MVGMRKEMPRKRKPSQDEGLPSNSSSEDGADATGKLSPKRKRKEKGSSTAESKKHAGRKPTDEEIRIRAYFIAEMRQRMSIPGDAHSDWIEARRQLLEELGG